MKINISNLKDGEHIFDFKEAPEVFGIESVKLDSEVDIHVVLYKMVNQFNLKITLSGDAILECDRCLDNYRTKFGNEFELIYKYDFGNDEDKEGTPEDDNFKYISPHTHTIDLTEDVRDYIILGIPMRKVPEEIDGICTVCNRNIDDLLNKKEEDSTNPVWDKLKNIRNN